MSKKITSWMKKPIMSFFDYPLTSFFGGISNRIGDCSFHQNDNEFIIEISTGDIPKEVWEINVEGDKLVVQVAQNKRMSEIDSENKYSDFSQYNTFSGKYHLPPECIVEEINATCKDGKLEIKIPKREKIKDEKVKVNIEEE